MLTAETLAGYLKDKTDECPHRRQAKYISQDVGIEYSFNKKVSTQKKFNLNEIFLGSCDKCNNIIVPERSVQATHAKIFYNRGKWLYRDESLIGSEINRRTVNGKTVRLKEGDEIVLGLYDLFSIEILYMRLYIFPRNLLHCAAKLQAPLQRLSEQRSFHALLFFAKVQESPHPLLQQQ